MSNEYTDAEADQIIDRLVRRAFEDQYPPQWIPSATKWAVQEEDIVLLRAYDTCFSEDYDFEDIDHGIALLRHNGLDDTTLTRSRIDGYREVCKLFTESDDRIHIPVRNSDRARIQLLGLTHPHLAGHVKTIVQERSITDATDILALAEEMDSGAAPLSEGAL